MVRGTLSYGKAVMLMALISSTGCTAKKNIAPPPSATMEALARTEGIVPMEPGSATERAALERFNQFYAVYSAEAIQSGLRGVYADDAWFGDPFHVVEGIDAIEHYFLVMAEPVESCTFRIDSMHRSGSDYFARWTMVLVSKAAKGNEPIEAIGVSHVRFNDEGKVVFQQDYWDTSVMFDRLPVVGFWTRLVKGRIAKGLDHEN